MKIRFLLPLVATLAACQPAVAPAPVSSPSVAPSASPSPSASPTETADTEGCEHLAGGPAAAVTASNATPPKVGNDHKRYDIALTADTGTTVQFQSDEAGDYVLFLNKDIPVKVKEVATGQAVAIEESTKSSATCTDVKGRHQLELGIGVYAIEFGPTTETQVSLVIEETGHGNDEHHD